MVLKLEMLPADRGDCLLIEYGVSEVVEHRILVDGGQPPSSTIEYKPTSRLGWPRERGQTPSYHAV